MHRDNIGLLSLMERNLPANRSSAPSEACDSAGAAHASVDGPGEAPSRTAGSAAAAQQRAAVADAPSQSAGASAADRLIQKYKI